MMILLFAVAMYSCADGKKEEKINLGDYNSANSVESTTETSSAAESADSADTSTADASATTENADASVVEVSIEGTDQMTFNKNEIKVPAGSTVKLTLTHVGSLPATVMGHNVVILKEGTDVTEFAQKAVNFPDNNYVPEDATSVVAHTKIVGGGESTTIEFEAPAPGTYTFICSFPGHYAMMKGKFIVE